MSSLVWVELSSSAVKKNLSILKNFTPNNTLFCAVVKSNAYGHGVREMVSLLESVDWFAVNSLEEGLELRELGVKKPILLLGYVPLNRLKEAIDANLKLTVYNIETVEKLSTILKTTEKKAHIHIKIETGTGRQGLTEEDIKLFIEKLKSLSNIDVEGISSHFANAEDPLNIEYSYEQIKKFKRAIDTITSKGIKPKIFHMASTAAAMLIPESRFSMVRHGIGLYGLWPSKQTHLVVSMKNPTLPNLEPVLKWKTRVIQIKNIPEGSFIGYGSTYKTTRPTRLGVLPVGYADGYSRSLSNSAYVILKGKRAPVIGRVCMNLTMIDITDIPGVKLEEEVTLLGKSGNEHLTAETMAGWARTINYEIVTKISPFLERKIVQ